MACRLGAGKIALRGLLGRSDRVYSLKIIKNADKLDKCVMQNVNTLMPIFYHF
jgi:hypothetical protein